MRLALPLVTLAAALAAGPMLRADEGMWTFDNLPLKKIQAVAGFTPDQAWVDHLRLSAVRFPGGSGSFISADGLVLTNHHVGRGAVQQLSTKENDYIKNGFIAGAREQELKVPGLELYTLVAMDNVTEQVNKAVKPGASEKDALEARKAELTRLQKVHQDKGGITAEPVVLYNGGEYWIYSYKKHTDVRLVMAPEMQIAFFGGDPDNFTFPRHNLDFTLFRVYEDGKPYKPAHRLAWSQSGVKLGDATFIVGHPGTTNRLDTLAQMRFAGEFALPKRLQVIEKLIHGLQGYAATSPEAARQANTAIFGMENGQKAMRGIVGGLQDKAAMARLEAAEKDLRAKVAADPKLQAKVGGSWSAIEKAMATRKALLKEYSFVGPLSSTALANALALVRLADESALPNDKRLPEYREANLEAAKRRLLVPRPFYPGMDKALFVAMLESAKEALGANHPFVKAVLGGKSVAEAAAVIDASRMGDVATRKALLEGGKKAVQESQDPLILLARRIDPMNRAIRKQMEDRVESVLNEHGGRIARARFDVYGKSVYPDATFTLRMTYGKVASYPANGTLTQPFTTFHGLFDRALAWGPEAEKGTWALPARWLDRKAKLNLDTPFCFVSDNDIIGGNSGSPVVDKKGELVGLVFDGNIESLPGNYFFDGKANRAVSVDGRAILEALDKVYDASHLVSEIKAR